MTPRVVLLYAALLGLILIFLSYRVVSYRVKYKIGIGDGGNQGRAEGQLVSGHTRAGQFRGIRANRAAADSFRRACGF